MTIEERLAEIASRESMTHEPYSCDVGCPQCGECIMFDFPNEKVGICNDCTGNLADEVPWLLALVNYYRSELLSIAMPRIGGKEQQYRAKAALQYNPDEK